MKDIGEYNESNTLSPKVEDIINEGKEAVRIAAEAVHGLLEHMNARFAKAVQMILECKERLVITGMGKPGHIGRKLVATFSSLGTAATFLDPAEAVHGDLGMVKKGDVILAISNSGETAEVLTIIPTLREIGVKIISITGNPLSTLARASDVVLEAGVDREADHLNLAPTASSTAELALGDALAVTVAKSRGFTKEDFGFFHPGGSLGKRVHSTSKSQVEA